MDKMNHTVLVVEDEQLLLQAITKKLTASGIGSQGYASGADAIEYLKKADKLPDAIWLDYYLKDMNGLEFMHAVKQEPKWSNIPVMVVSNSATDDKVHSMLALGIKKYLLKAEYRLDELIVIVKEFIGTQE